MTPEQKLDLLLGKALPSRRDLGFLTEVARRVALRRAWWRVAALLPWLVIACLLMWALVPVLVDLWQELVRVMAPSAVALAGSALLAMSAIWLTRRLGRAR